MKHLLLSLLLLLPSVCLFAQEDEVIHIYPRNVQWSYDESGVHLELAIGFYNTSSTVSYTGNLYCMLRGYINDSYVSGSGKEADRQQVWIIPGDNNHYNYIVFSGLDPAIDYYSADVYLSYTGDDGSEGFVEETDLRFSLPGLIEKLSGAYGEDKWTNTDDDGLTLETSLTVSNGSDSDFNDSIKVVYYKDQSAYYPMKEEIFVTQVPANGSVTIPITLTGLDVGDYHDYRIETSYYSSALGKYKELDGGYNVGFFPDEVLSVGSITTPANALTKVYDISGRYVGTMDSGRIKSLEKGLYIINRRKVVVR